MDRAYVGRRVGQAGLVIALVYTIVFSTLFLLPGDPIENKLNSPVNPLPPSAAENLLAYYQLDLPAHEQFALGLGRLLTGDLGYSLVSGRPVTELLAQGLADTAALAGLAFVLTLTLSLTVALTATYGRWPWLRGLAGSVPVMSVSAPSFLIGFLLLSVFSFQLGWFSSIRDQGLWSAVLPAVTLAIAANGALTQVLVRGLAKARDEPFVAVLRAKGLSEPRIAVGHVLRNGAVPGITMLGLLIGELFAGAVVVETVFSRTGLGFVTFESVRDQDTPVVLAIVLLVSTVYVLVNLAADLLYPVLDPRIVRAGRVVPRRRRTVTEEVAAA